MLTPTHKSAVLISTFFTAGTLHEACALSCWPAWTGKYSWEHVSLPNSITHDQTRSPTSCVQLSETRSLLTTLGCIMQLEQPRNLETTICLWRVPSPQDFLYRLSWCAWQGFLHCACLDLEERLPTSHHATTLLSNKQTRAEGTCEDRFA